MIDSTNTNSADASTDLETTAPPKKNKGGRPVGSKGKNVSNREIPPAKPRGRPVGWRKPVDSTREAAAVKKRGRPVGAKMKTMNDLAELTLEDFCYLRAVTQKIKAHEAYLLYYSHIEYDAKGEPLIPHGLTLNQKAEDIVEKIVSFTSVAVEANIRNAGKYLLMPIQEVEITQEEQNAVHMEFQEWYDKQPPDFYSESELPGEYARYLAEQKGGATQGQAQMLQNTIGVKDKVTAINTLQSALARRPRTADALTFWFADPVYVALNSTGLKTLADLVELISTSGKKWHSKVHGLSPIRAGRIVAWLEFHKETIGEIKRTGMAWARPTKLPLITPLQRLTGPLELVLDSDTGAVTLPSSAALMTRDGIAPLELMRVPDELDGRNGMFRSLAPNQLGAQTDMKAILTILNSYLTAGQTKTLVAYRKEIERFYLWCIHVMQTPISSISLPHAQAYQLFLKNIPDEWINPTPVPRTSLEWRPFRAQLSAKSQNYAISVVHKFYTSLHKNGYLTSHAFHNIHSIAIGHERPLDTTRSFRKDDVNLILRTLPLLPGLSSNNPIKAALARRMRLILDLGLTTGMRLAEIESANLDSLDHPEIDGIKHESWIIIVTGKRGKKREIPISERILQDIYSHHSDIEDMAIFSGKRLTRFKATKPLVAALEPPVQDGSREINDETTMSNDNGALSRNGLYKAMKTFLRFAAKHTDDPRQKERFSRASPHWMRHTFAQYIIESNDNDAGLKNAQQLLGHTSIATTGEYITQDISSKIKAAIKVDPLGSAEM